MSKSALMSRPEPAIHGHRGARGHRPENTLGGVDFAIQAGSDAVEVDLRFCGDGSVVLYHDAAISSRLATHTTRGRNFMPLPLSDIGLPGIREFDVGTAQPGSDVARRFPQQVAVPGEGIPTLDEFLGHVIDHAPPGFIVNLELKSEGLTAGDWIRDYVGAVLESVKHFDMLERTYLQSFDWRLAIEARRQSPGLLTGLLTDQQHDGEPRIPVSGVPDHRSGGLDLADFGDSIPRMILAAGGRVWSGNHHDLSAEQVDEAHSLGLGVYTWTVNDTADMERVIALGVDAITTDYPGRLVSLLRDMRS